MLIKLQVNIREVHNQINDINTIPNLLSIAEKQ